MTTEQIAAFVKNVSTSINRSLMVPRGTKHAALQTYLDKYTDDDIAVFLKKLKTSRWVNNDYFSFDRMIKEDIIGSVMAGGSQELKALNKYYSPKILTIVRKK